MDIKRNKMYSRSTETIMPNVKSFTQIIRDNPLQTITTFIAIIGVAVSIFSLWLLSHVAPLIVSIDRLEATSEERGVFINRFIVTEEKVMRVESDVTEIKNSQLRMEARINQILERQ